MSGSEFDQLFGRLAVRLNVLTELQLLKAQETARNRADADLASVLVQLGTITTRQRDYVHGEATALVERHNGDVSAALEVVDTVGNPTLSPERPKYDEETVDTKPDMSPRPPTSAENTAPFEKTVITSGADLDDTGHLAETLDRQGGEEGVFGATFITPLEIDTSERLDNRDIDSSLRSRYTLTRVCGVGGIGEVWLAKDPQLKRDVALKRFRADRTVDEDTQQRLVKEAQITGQLEHPNIVPVHELDRMGDGSPYYTMKLLRGQTLSQRIQEYHKHKKQGGDSTLALHELLNIFIDVCNAVAYAGARGIVHRDLKPANIMLGGFGEVLVLDWGLATLVDPAESGSDDETVGRVTLEESVNLMDTLEGQIVGTPAYMAPEQAAGRISLIDQRTDVYGLGAVLYAMLLGTTPHRGQQTGNTARDTVQLLKRISDGPTPEPRTADPTIPAPLNAICARAMNRSRSDRYQTATDMAEDIRRWIADEPVSAYPESGIERAQRWFRKHRALAQGALIAAVLTAVVATIAAFLINSARQREAEAHAATAAARQTALEHFQRTRGMVDELLTGLSDGLLDLPGTQEFRAELLTYAAEEYSKLVAEKSDDPELQRERTRALVKLGDVQRLLIKYEEAEGAYQSALESLGSDRTDRLEVARIYNKLGQLYGAMDRLADSEAAYVKVGETLADDGQADTLDEWRLRAAARGNLGMLLSQMSRFDDAEPDLTYATEEWLKLSNQSNLARDRMALALMQVAVGEHHQQTGKLDESLSSIADAINGFKALIDEDENEPAYTQGLADALLTRASTYYLRGQTKEQIESTSAAIGEYGVLIDTKQDVPAYRENRTAARTDLAQAFYRQGLPQDAFDAANQALVTASSFAHNYPRVPRYRVAEVYARVTAAQILRDVEDFDLAIEQMELGVEICTGLIENFPENQAQYYQLRGLCRSNLGLVGLLTGDLEQTRQLLEQAHQDFDTSLELAPGVPQARDSLAWTLTYLGDVLSALDRTEDAAAAYREAIKLRGAATDKSPNELGNEAWLLLNCRDESLRNPTQARASANLAAETAPTNAEYQTLIAASYYRNEDYALCLETLAAARTPNVSLKNTIGFWQAMALWQSGEQDQALEAFQKAVEAMNEVAPADYRLRAVREEAVELLGIVLETQ